MLPINLLLPEGFLEEETRWEYTITRHMKEVWAVELDLLQLFDSICQKYDIKYVACGGTLLGAIRHKGMIPWDDDIDVMMKRSEYERFCEVAPSIIKGRYFFQTHESDPHYHQHFAKIRNSETAAIESDFLNEFNHGIFIDIFPLDNMDDDKERFLKNAKRIHIYNGLSFLFDNKKISYNNRLICFLFTLVNKVLPSFILNSISHYGYKKAEHYARINEFTRTNKVASLIERPFNPFQCLNASDLDDVEMADFEFLQIPVPRNYNEVLTNLFGDYMVPLQTGGLHSGISFDTRHSYLSIKQ